MRRRQPARATVVHFHGGGYCLGSAGTARSWAAHLSAAAGCTVILPEYRLAPEHRFPAAVEDAKAVVAALTDETGPASVVLSGDSAGGGLALAVAISMREDGKALPAGCILLSPWLDLGRDRAADPALARRDLMLTPEWLGACARAYADPSSWSDPLVSPLHAPHGGLMPLLIQVGTDEVLAPDAEGTGRKRDGGRRGRHLQQVARHVARLRAAAGHARRRGQRAGPVGLVRPLGRAGAEVAEVACRADIACRAGVACGLSAATPTDVSRLHAIYTSCSQARS